MTRRQPTTGCICSDEASRAEEQGLPDVAQLIRDNCSAGRAHIRDGSFTKDGQ